jgi:hypothetical protein
MDYGLLAKPVIGPTKGRTRWLGPGMTLNRA